MTTFVYAVRYQVEATCLTPLRSGAGETEEVLRDQDGRMFVQGSSIAGALRDWLEKNSSKSRAEALFGSQKQSGRLIVSDGVFDPAASMTSRPRLRINGASGSADDGGKFDIAHVSTGSVLRFSLTWLGQTPDPEELEMIEQLLSALDQGLIFLGAQKSNGFGRVSLKVEKRCYDMKQKQDREDWQLDRFDGAPLSLPALKASGTVIFEVQAHADRILVKSGVPQQEAGEKQGSYTPNLEENGRPVIPGSSVKGAVLSRARSIADFMKLPVTFADQAFGRGAKAEDNGLAGQFRFEDAYPTQVKKQKITRIRIDRFTGGVIRNGLFREEPVTGDLTLRITAPEDQEAACGLLLYALRDLGLGLYSLGSNGAIGRGFLKVRNISAVCGTQKLSLSFSGERDAKVSLKDEDGLAERWLKALEEVRHEV